MAVPWAALATLLLSKVAEGFGERLGQGIADEVLKIFRDERGDGDYTKYFNEVADRIIAEVKNIVVSNDLRIRNAELAAVIDDYQSYLTAREARQKRIAPLQDRSGTVWTNLVSLTSITPAAIGSLYTSAAVQVGLEYEWFRTLKRRDEIKGEAEVFLGLLHHVNKVVRDATLQIEEKYKQRVQGPVVGSWAGRVSIQCGRDPEFDPDRGGGRRLTVMFRDQKMDIEINKATIARLEATVPGVLFRSKDVQAIGWEIDGVRTSLPYHNCNGGQNNWSVERANEACTQTRKLFRDEYEEKFDSPSRIIKEKNEKLMEMLGKYLT